MATLEENAIEALKDLQATYKDEPKQAGAKSAYLASPWFDEKQAELLIHSYKYLLQNPTIGHIHVPLLNQYKGMVLSGGDTKYSDADKYEWAVHTYKSDLEAIKNSDLSVALETPNDVDSGTSVEIGLTVGMNKPVVALFNGDLYKTPVNLMESFGVTSYVTDPEELKDFNFLSIPVRKFEGTII